jgi:hypothetical protein
MHLWLIILNIIMAYLIVKTANNKLLNQIISLLSCVVILFDLMSL